MLINLRLARPTRNRLLELVCACGGPSNPSVGLLSTLTSSLTHYAGKSHVLGQRPENDFVSIELENHFRCVFGGLAQAHSMTSFLGITNKTYPFLLIYSCNPRHIVYH